MFIIRIRNSNIHTFLHFFDNYHENFEGVINVKLAMFPKLTSIIANGNTKIVKKE